MTPVTATAADMDAKLIRLVENFPGIYDRNCPDHKNPLSLAQMWAIISRKLRMPSEECQEKWKYLRRRFTQASPAWQYYQSLTFLEPFIKRRKLSMGNSSDLKNNEVIVVEESEDMKPDAPVKRKKKRKMIREEEEDGVVIKQLFRGKNPEEDSVYSFCNSLSSDLLKLPPQRMLNCRIDILSLIQKYMLEMHDANKNDEEETLVSVLMKHFNAVENKIMAAKMTPDDRDWIFLYSIKNFFSKMMVLRNYNDELNNLLKNFQFVEEDQTESNGSVQENTNSFPTTATQSSSDFGVEYNADIIQNEVTTSENTVMEPVTKHSEVVPEQIVVLKGKILSGGWMREDYCLNFCVKKVHQSVYSVSKENLRCRVCHENILSLSQLNEHNSETRHLRRTMYTKRSVDFSDFVKKGVLELGTSSRFCLLCRTHDLTSPDHVKNHKKKLMEVEGYCKVSNTMYCFICAKSFCFNFLMQHGHGEEHKLNLNDYYHKNKNLYDC